MKTQFKREKPKDLISVPMDETGSKANAYLDLIEEIAKANEEKDHAGAELVEALRAVGRTAIRVRGTTLSIKEIEAKVKIVSKKEE